jgi:HK97 gp10 family phage protein
MSQVKRLLDAKRGRAEIRRRLMQFADQAPLEITAQLESSAGEMTVSMRRLVPVLKIPHVKREAGELKRSIGFGPEVPPEAKISAKGKVGRTTIYIWAGNFKAFYARWVEFGTQTMAAHPFFWPIWRAYKKTVKKDMRRAYKKVAQQVFGNAK